MASSIVKSAAQQLGRLGVQEAKSLYKVKHKIESLQMELEWIECFLKDADTQQHNDEVIRKWVSQVRDFAYDSQDIIEKFVHRVSHHRRDGLLNTLQWFSCILCSGDVMTLHNLGSELDFLASRMAELTSRLQRYGVQLIKPTKSLEYSRMMRERWRTYSYSKEEVVGLDEDIQQVVDQLLTTNVSVVGISGTGGLGKTTLARKVVKHKDVARSFNENFVWVYLSKEFDTENVFQEILLGLEENVTKEKKFEEEEEEEKKLRKKKKENKGPLKGEELVKEIRKRFQVQKYLIVLDDIWTAKDWWRLKPVFGSIGEGALSKILLTTRYQGLVEDIDPKSGYHHILKPLSSGDSWELILRKASYRRNTDNEKVKREPMDIEMEKLGREMLAHCDGLPIAIIALGGILSAKNTLSEWQDVQLNISSYLTSNVDYEERNTGRVLEVLELSYQELPYYIKPCFLFLGHIREDHKISAQMLYHLWDAEGFLVREGEVKKQGATYDIGERYLSEMIQRSMVEVDEVWPSGRIKTCQFHDVMRDMCLRKCEEVGFLNYVHCTESDIDSMLPTFSTEIKKLRRCVVHDQKGDAVVKHFEKGGEVTSLRSMLMFKSDIYPRIWTLFLLLRVLSLEGIDSGCIEGVGKLIHLRYLSLRNSKLERLPSDLFGLSYLETLDLRLNHGHDRGSNREARNLYRKTRGDKNYFKEVVRKKNMLYGDHDSDSEDPVANNTCMDSAKQWFIDGTIDRVRAKWKELSNSAQGYGSIKLRRNNFDKMKRLRHLYLPAYCVRNRKDEMVSIGSAQMETLVNFDPTVCELKGIFNRSSHIWQFFNHNSHTFQHFIKIATTVLNTRELLACLVLGYFGGVFRF